MTNVNHILTGSVIALTVTNPVVAAPLALVSHFVLDALPHFGLGDSKDHRIIPRDVMAQIVLVVDLGLSAIILAVLAISGEWYVLLIGLIAALPDLAGPYNGLMRNRMNRAPSRWYRLLHDNFHRPIQRFESCAGIIVEAFVFIVLLALLNDLRG